MSSFFPLYSVKGFSGGLGDFFLGIQKQFYQVGIKIRAGALFDNGKARFQRHCIPVAAFLGYGIEYIRNCHNSGVEGDTFTNQSLWVVPPVVFLMMVSGNLVCNLQKIRVFQVMKAVFMISPPWAACSFIIANSSGISFPGFCRILSGVTILPMSCKGAALLTLVR